MYCHGVDISYETAARGLRVAQDAAPDPKTKHVATTYPLVLFLEAVDYPLDLALTEIQGALHGAQRRGMQMQIREGSG
jgi:hypothetical protein